MSNFSEAMGELDDRYISEAISYRPKAKQRGWMRWAACAACLALVFAVAGRWNAAKNQLPLSDRSANVTVRYTNGPFFTQSKSSLIYLTEEELFTRFDTAIFKGTVVEINNIKLDFGTSKDYRAIAEIEVETVYRGPCAAGDRVSVLLPCPIMEGLWVEDTGVISQLRTGMTGIFMPVIYNEDSIWGQGAAVLALTDIADYGLADGMRYAFLETERGLVFASFAYESIARATRLDEVEAYILTMIDG